MRELRLARSLVAVAILLLPGAACFARVPSLKPYVPDDKRHVEGGRKVLLVMETDALDAGMKVDQQRYTSTGDSYVELLPGQTIEAFTRELVETQTFINPLRGELAGFGFEKRMREQLESVVMASPWLGARDFELEQGYHAAKVERVLNESDTRQMLLLRVAYQMSYRFDRLTVRMQASMLVRQIPRGEYSDARLKGDYIPYRLTFEAVAALPDADRKDRKANRDRWVANHGALARSALQAEADWITARFAETLAQDEAQSASWRNRNDRVGRLPNGRPGWILEQGPRGTVSYASRGQTLIFELPAP